MYLAIDIGGTKTLLGRFTNDGVLQDSIKFPTPKTYEDFSVELANNIVRITTKPWTMAAIGSPGIIDRENGIARNINNLGWKDIPLVELVKSITKCPVLIENDAKLAGLSEARLLKPLRNRTYYLTVSTGIGGAFVVKGKLDKDLEDTEPGQMVFEKDGKTVTWESFASGKAIVKRFHKRASEINDPHVWQLISEDLALGLIDVMANVQPDVVIIGGGVGSHFKKFSEPLKKELDKYASPLVKVPPVIGAKRPEEAVIYGCYELLKDQ